MTNESLYTRRRMLSLSGTAAAIGLAGCSGGQAESDGGSESTEEHSDSDGHNETESHDDSEDEHSEEEESHDDEEEGHGEDSHHDGEIGAPTETAQVNMITTDGTYHFRPSRGPSRGRRHGDLPQRKWEPLCHGLPTQTTINHSSSPTEPRRGTAASSEAGATFEHTFETEGVYHYYCTPHETVGMIGSIIVGEPDAHGQPALEEPPQDKPESVTKKISNSTRCVTKRSATDTNPKTAPFFETAGMV